MVKKGLSVEEKRVKLLEVRVATAKSNCQTVIKSKPRKDAVLMLCCRFTTARRKL
jgi:hypothetical protein